MSPLAFEYAIRGTACGLFLLTAGLIWRDRRRTLVGRLSAAVAFSAAAASVNSMPGFQQAGFVWRAPLLVLAAGTPAMLWLWAKAVFDDDFIPRRRYAAPWLVSAVGVMLSAYGGAAWSWTAPAGDIMLQVWNLGLAVLVAAQTTATWRTDLVMGRRRLRVAVLLGSVLFISIDAIWSSGIGPFGVTPVAIDTIRIAGPCTLAVLAAWSLLQVAPIESAPAMVSRNMDDAGPALESKSPSKAVAPALLKRLEQLMTEERIFRQEGLTIGALATRLAVPEERLRRAINEGLGYRNFNAFINHYRLADAKTALSDASQDDVPVLTIAMDAGFQSLGPFNRAFKADTGMTPTEYRRMARSAPLAGESPSGKAG
jgi:AraC-like DNA-binding protein